MKLLLRPNNIFAQFLTAASVFISRLNILPANISPLGSFGFFGNPFLFGASIVAFDFLVKGVYPGFWLTYVGFACYPILGKLAGESIKRKVFLLPLASLLFFFFSNLGVWWYWYDHTLVKLLVCFSLAVPFYTRTLMSDLVFGYGYLLITHVLNLKKVPSSTKVYI